MQLDFTDQELQALINIMANTRDFPWTVTNPLLVKLTRAQQVQNLPQPAEARHSGNSQSPLSPGDL